MKRTLISLLGFSTLVPIIGMDLRSADTQITEKQNASNNIHDFLAVIGSNQSLLIIIFAAVAIILLGFTLYKIKHERIADKGNDPLLISGF